MDLAARTASFGAGTAGRAAEVVAMPNTEFLETYPLYRDFNLKLPATADRLPYVPIKLQCDECKSDQTYNMQNTYQQGANISNADIAGQVFWLRYQCMSCNKSIRDFFIKIDEQLTYMVKIGQNPAWDVVGDKNIKSMLGNHADYYRRGLIFESQSYGVAAFAYYRRTVEKIIDQLLSQIVELIEPRDRPMYLAALEKTKRTNVAMEKIDFMKDLLPPILRPNQLNPLGLLHASLNEGLHAQNEEECQISAMEIRKILAFLTDQITASANAARAFDESMKTLLDKKTRKIRGN